MPYLTPPGKALNTSIGVTPLAGEGIYIFSANGLESVTPTASIGAVMLIAGVTDAVCTAVGVNLYGAGTNGAFPMNLGISTASFVNGGTAAVPTTGSYSVWATDVYHPKGGCNKTTDGANHNVITIPL